VKSNFGYHVIMLDDTRKPELPEFAAVSDKVKQSLTQQAIQKHLAELLTKAKVQSQAIPSRGAASVGSTPSHLSSIWSRAPAQ
jgi:peptidyl-prolyl cis-trans isomerase C